MNQDTVAVIAAIIVAVVGVFVAGQWTIMQRMDKFLKNVHESPVLLNFIDALYHSQRDDVKNVIKDVSAIVNDVVKDDIEPAPTNPIGKVG